MTCSADSQHMNFNIGISLRVGPALAFDFPGTRNIKDNMKRRTAL